MHHLNRIGGEWLFVWAVVCIIIAALQIAIIALPDSVYWNWYDTSSDVFDVSLSFALYNAISYRAVSHKALSIGLVVWCSYCFISNTITDYMAAQGSDVLLSSVFMLAALIILFSFRFLLRFHPNRDELQSGKFYELRGYPESSAQALVAAYTGEAGSVWHNRWQAPMALLQAPRRINQ